MTSHQTFLCAAIAAAMGLLIAQPAQAQRTGGRPVGAVGPATPPQTARPSGPSGAGSGDVMQIVKFTPADEAKNPDLIGTLTLKPFRKGMKPVTVRILKEEDAKISIGSVGFTPDRYAEILTKGLQCNVAWTQEGDKPSSPKNMSTIGFQPISVIGIVDSVEGDVITIKNALPSDGRNWPDDELASMPAPTVPRPPTASPSGASRPPPTTPRVQPIKKVKMRKLKVRAFEEVAKLTDENNEEISAGDIPVGTKVEVAVILSKTTGIMTTLAYTNASAVVNKEGPRPLPPRPTGGGGPAGGG